MKILPFLVVLVISSCAGANESVYIGSTPGHPIVKKFLGIAMTDSVDFIRWRLTLKDDAFSLQCRYGVAKQGTDRFVDEKTAGLTGNVVRSNGEIILQHAHAELLLTELNNSLLHLSDGKGSLIPGNAGWSFALSGETPHITEHLSLPAKKISLKDSAIFQGRTPCGKISSAARFNRPDCFKLKWYLVLYTDGNGKPSTYRIRGTAFSDSDYEKRGVWKIGEKNGRDVYQLDLGGNEGSLYFIRVEENILLLSDVSGNVLVGNRDFSYVLSKI